VSGSHHWFPSAVGALLFLREAAGVAMTLWRVALLLVLFLACLSLGASAASVNGTSVVVWVDGSSTLAVASCEEAPLPCGTEEQPCGSIAGVVDALQPCLCQFNSTDPCIASVEFMLTGNVHLNTSLQLPAAHWAFTYVSLPSLAQCSLSQVLAS
jgi:hypothetical protein